MKQNGPSQYLLMAVMLAKLGLPFATIKNEGSYVPHIDVQFPEASNTPVNYSMRKEEEC